MLACLEGCKNFAWKELLRFIAGLQLKAKQLNGRNANKTKLKDDIFEVCFSTCLYISLFLKFNPIDIASHLSIVTCMLLFIANNA